MFCCTQNLMLELVVVDVVMYVQNPVLVFCAHNETVTDLQFRQSIPV